MYLLLSAWNKCFQIKLNDIYKAELLNIYDNNAISKYNVHARNLIMLQILFNVKDTLKLFRLYFKAEFTICITYIAYTQTFMSEHFTRQTLLNTKSIPATLGLKTEKAWRFRNSCTLNYNVFQSFWKSLKVSSYGKNPRGRLYFSNRWFLSVCTLTVHVFISMDSVECVSHLELLKTNWTLSNWTWCLCFLGFVKSLFWVVCYHKRASSSTSY